MVAQPPRGTARNAELRRHEAFQHAHVAMITLPTPAGPLVPGASERLRSFRREQIYEAVAPASAVLDDLEHIEEVDGRAEAHQRWLGRLAWLAGPGAVAHAVGLFVQILSDASLDERVLGPVMVGAMFAFVGLPIAYPFIRRRIFPVLHPPSGDSGWLLAGMALLGVAAWWLGSTALEALPPHTARVAAIGWLGAGVALFLLHRHRRRANTENRRYALAHAVLSVLRRDMAPDEPVRLRLDLRPPNISAKLANTTKQDVFGGAARVGRFVDPWLSLQGRLLDGTRFALSLTQATTVKNVVKGRKNKFKTKTKSKERATLELRVKPDKVPGLERVAQRAQGALQLARHVRVRRFQGAADRLAVEVGFLSGDDGDDTAWVQSRRQCALQMFLGLYQVIHAAKELAAGAPRTRS